MNVCVFVLCNVKCTRMMKIKKNKKNKKTCAYCYKENINRNLGWGTGTTFYIKFGKI